MKMKLHQTGRKSLRRFAFGFVSLLVTQAAWAWPNLAVVKTGPAQAAPGDLVSYTLSYSNSGPVNGPGVVLKDFIPAYVTVVTNTLNGGSLSGSTITWNLGTVSSRAGGSRSFQVRVLTNTPSGLYLTNRAQVFSSEAEEPGKTNDNYSKVVTRIINRPPVAQNDSYTVNEDTALMISAPGVLANDSDPDGHPLKAILASGPTHGTLTLNTNGSFTYSPATNYNGGDAFTYKANDGITNSGVATVSITVTPKNDAPMAANDSYTTAEDTTFNVSAPGVLSNDSDADGDPLKAILVSGPAHGTLTFNTNGGFSYSPTNNYVGGDTFTYRANDGTTNSGVATVTITVTPLNDPPIAVDDSYIVNEDTIRNVPSPGILANDSDPDGNAIIGLLVAGPAHGALILGTNGNFTYQPVSNYTGSDSFTYRAFDGQTNSNIARVSLTINPVNDRPVAVNDAYTTPEDTALNISVPGVLTNDSDADGDALTVMLTSSPTHGTLTISTNGGFTYAPTNHYNGPDSFTYRAFDGTTNSANLATVTITVTPVNDAPVAVNDSYTTPEDTTLNIAAPGVLSNDSDADGDALKAILVTGSAHGTLILSTNGSFSYTPSINFTGPDSFTYRANDGQSNSGMATVSITVTPLNDAPVALPDNYTTPEDTTLNIPASGVLTNDSDADGDALSAVLVSNPTHGALTLSTNGGFSYIPTNHFHGLDNFTYKTSDGLTNSSVATVTIRVTPENDPPNTNNWSGHSFSVLEDTVLTVNAPGVLAGLTDADGDVLSAVFVSNPTHGSLNLNANGSFTYTPMANYYGPDSFQFKASDGQVSSPTLTVNITVLPVNDPPSFTKGANQLLQQNAGPQTLPAWATNISPGPTNEASQTVTFQVSNTNNALFATQPAIAANGTLSYTPAINAHGVATVTVVARDNGGTANGGVDSSAPQTFAISINAPPTVNIASPTNGAQFFAPADFTVLADAQDVDGTIAKVEFFSGTNTLGEVMSGESYFIVRTNVPVGSYTFSATATDNLGATGSAEPVTISVIERPPLTVLSALQYNPQTDFFEVKVRISNPTYSTLNAVRVLVYNLTNTPAITVYNPSGFTNGVPYIQSHGAVAPGSYVDMTIEFLTPLRIMPNPILQAELVPPAIGDGGALLGTPQRINRGLMLADRTFLLEFLTMSNRVYSVQYSSNLADWKAAQPAISGDGNWRQWIDNGEPKTESAPATQQARFYRLLLLP